jgi:tripartite ATP-independent transporter DctP family solute receptor
MKFLFATAATAALALASSAAQAETIQLKLGHGLNIDNHYQIAATGLAERVAKKSNGQIKIEVFPQLQLGGEVKMIQAARSGGLDMLIVSQAAMVNTVKAYSIFDIPYLFDSMAQANKVLSAPVGKTFLDMLPKYNLVGLGFLSVMERNLFTSKPIQKAGDMQGMKVRVIQSPGYVKAYESFGTQPTPMAYGDVYMALQQGVVDGADTSPDQFVTDKFIEISKYYNLTRMHYLPALLMVSKTTWDKLNAQQRKMLQECATEAIAESRAYYAKSYSDAIAQMKRAGVNVVEPDMKSMKQTSSKVIEQLLPAIPDGKKLFEQIQAAKKGA